MDSLKHNVAVSGISISLVKIGRGFVFCRVVEDEVGHLCEERERQWLLA